MNKKLRNLAGILILLMLMVFKGCGKADPPLEPEKPVVTVPIPTPPGPTTPGPENPTPPNSTAKLIPVKIESTLGILTFKYVGNTGKLYVFEDGQTKKTGSINYSNDLLTGFQLNEINGLTYFVEYWKTNQIVNRVTQFNQKGNIITPLGEYTLEYNNLQQIKDIKYYLPNKQLTSSLTLAYDASLNNNSITNNLNPDEDILFTFDKKNGLFKYVENAQLMSLEMPHKLFYCTVNNVLTKTKGPATAAYSYTYEYNADDFPSVITLTEGNTKTVFKITYKTL
ncbi:hypothetical protein [Pedobacter sp.]|uniref:hypothetical protein n=1 Tax=Pedobacter sp. TaxID=1411316 RepID=UPI003D7F5FB6